MLSNRPDALLEEGEQPHVATIPAQLAPGVVSHKSIVEVVALPLDHVD